MTIKRSFTLQELMLILSCVALGAALLLPAGSAWKRAAKADQCRQNLQKIVTAQILYSEDNGRQIAGFFRRDGKNRTWSRILVSDTHYLLGPAFLSCPANTSPDGAARREKASAIWDFNCYGMYAGNTNADDWDYAKRVRGKLGDFAKGQMFTDFYVIDLRLVRDPAHTVLLADSAKFSGSHAPFSYFAPRGFFQESAVNLLHDNKANTACMDGSVRSAGADELAASPLGFQKFTDGNFGKKEL